MTRRTPPVGVLCHNICVVIQNIYEPGLEVEFVVIIYLTQINAHRGGNSSILRTIGY
jgi:hypothetical protein